MTTLEVAMNGLFWLGISIGVLAIVAIVIDQIQSEIEFQRDKKRSQQQREERERVAQEDFDGLDLINNDAAEIKAQRAAIEALNKSELAMLDGMREEKEND